MRVKIKLVNEVGGTSKRRFEGARLFSQRDIHRVEESITKKWETKYKKVLCRKLSE